MEREWKDKILNLTEAEFLPAALWLFEHQYQNNAFYRQYVDLLGVNVHQVTQLEQIPFLPIRFFKSAVIKTGQWQEQQIFASSGTTGSINSRHFVRDLSIYEASFRKGFELFYGDVRDYCVLGLLPNYLERGQSSLVYMVNDLINRSKHPDSGFYLYDFGQLNQTLNKLKAQNQPTLLIGVTFALLDFAEQYPGALPHCVIMETGGMKGRKKELLRNEVHELLKKAFKVPQIHSEYGMTELLSQAYATADGRFKTVPWMKCLMRADDDPLQVSPAGSPGRGALNIIDLANIDSCAFIATDDAVQFLSNNEFEVLGRLDNSDIRGCSLMAV